MNKLIKSRSLILSLSLSLSLVAIDLSSSEIFDIQQKDKSLGLSSFQQQIENCGFDFKHLKNIKSITHLFEAMDKKYLMISNKTIYRELLYKVQNENRKLKITNDQIEVYHVDKNDNHTAIKMFNGGVDIDAHYKKKSLQVQISQLILNAKVKQDWEKKLEIRENGLKVEWVRVDQNLNQLKMILGKKQKTLDCQKTFKTEICLCQKNE